MSSYRIIRAGTSNSFPDSHPFLEAGKADGAGVVILGADAGTAYAALTARESFEFVAIELGMECLGVHTGESLLRPRPANVVGFARFRLGNSPPSDLVEIVKQADTSPGALAAARASFDGAKLTTAVCNDFPGRIVNRLIRPFYNAVLRRYDEGLASAADLDKTLCLGLGYPEGTLALLERTGLEHHYETTLSLYEALGQEPFLPARRAAVARAFSRAR
jgi:3-hydroxybutyryl-CoA dehydrogenase